MTSAVPVQTTDDDGILQKAAWLEPTIEKLDFSNAAGGDGSGPDSGFVS
jgi:hypothetical protein